ncbi:MAG: 4Fe-4S dicluster domain-containing protein [Chloroflexi bacterium]|nr:MAG: NADH:ubiquinone oxidoreductase chain I-like protein [Phototrophicales bacterium]RMF78650.1 MAG: 4Fe-4S dicluster domain-containing protein [Chloroflexota bacterium]
MAEGGFGYGLGILKGMGVTFKHFVNTYAADIGYLLNMYSDRPGSGTKFETRQGLKARGMYTVEYPDEKLAVPERFRFVPFLIVEDYDHEERPGHDWCTSCGICAKVCPPQCIWIVRGTNPETGRPKPEPEAFFIDIDICMNCGYCAEFCPFDAIKMDHDYELASYDRTTNHIFDKQKLSKEFRYWRTIAPTTAVEEMEARGGWEHTDVIKARKKAEKAGGKAAAKSKPKAAPKAEVKPAADAAPAAPAPVAEAPVPEDDPNIDPKKARLMKKRAEMLARKEARKKNK